MIYFAHRGASAYALANSKESFSLARAQGATHYELDVHLTQDKRLVVQHDYLIGKTEHSIKEFGWSKLQIFCLEHQILCPPLLEEILPLVKPDLKCLNIELKNDDNVYPGMERALFDLLSSQAEDILPKILFSSFDFSTLQRLRYLAPLAKIGLLTRDFKSSQAQELDAYSVHMNQTRITAQIVQTCHAENRRVFVYTVNTTEDEKRLAQMGVDGIFTDRLDLFMK